MYKYLYSKHFIITVILMSNINTIDPQYDYYDSHNVQGYYENDSSSDYILPRDETVTKKKIKPRKPSTRVRYNKMIRDLLDPEKSIEDADAHLPPAPLRRASTACTNYRCESCLKSCQYMKKSRVNTSPVVSFLFLRICGVGCRLNIQCLTNSYCLPLMEENPDYFVACVNNCNIFALVPKLFLSFQPVKKRSSPRFRSFMSGYYDNDSSSDYELAGEETESIQKFKPRKSSTLIAYDKLFRDLLDPDMGIEDVDAELPRPIMIRASKFCSSNIGGGSCKYCLDSCYYLNNSKVKSSPITKYLFLRICAIGCRENIKCLNDNYCLPIMEENPDYFVWCVNKCNPWMLIPKVLSLK